MHHIYRVVSHLNHKVMAVKKIYNSFESFVCMTVMSQTIVKNNFMKDLVHFVKNKSIFTNVQCCSKIHFILLETVIYSIYLLQSMIEKWVHEWFRHFFSTVPSNGLENPPSRFDWCHASTLFSIISTCCFSIFLFFWNHVACVIVGQV